VTWVAGAQFAKLHRAASRFMWEEVMTIDRKFTIATVVATVTALTAAVSVQAGGDKIMFPAEYAKGAVYMTLDRPEN
jgi:hypothetical protein